MNTHAVLMMCLLNCSFLSKDRGTCMDQLGVEEYK